MSENAAESFLAGVADGWELGCRGNGWGDYGNPCWGYAHTESPCATCCLMNSAGFVETDDNFPLTLVAHRGDKTIPVLNVRADSIEAKESIIAGYVDLFFEVYGTDVTGTVPMVDYWTTES